jgi:hypothetical protein
MVPGKPGEKGEAAKPGEATEISELKRNSPTCSRRSTSFRKIAADLSAQRGKKQKRPPIDGLLFYFRPSGVRAGGAVDQSPEPIERSRQRRGCRW